MKKKKSKQKNKLIEICDQLQKSLDKLRANALETSTSDPHTVEGYYAKSKMKKKRAKRKK